MADKKAKVGVVKYFGQVRQEGRKVVWPTMNETMITTVLVLILMVIFGIFFFFVDWFAANGTQFLLSIGTDSGSGPGAGG
ncbi:MAG: preprotein translocase subunit SecE [Robiginitomaculum sp.]|nr:MAG: preprotein translocase subunit SecE [Robiginitomaculum sp.]